MFRAFRALAAENWSAEVVCTELMKDLAGVSKSINSVLCQALVHKEVTALRGRRNCILVAQKQTSVCFAVSSGEELCPGTKSLHSR